MEAIRKSQEMFPSYNNNNKKEKKNKKKQTKNVMGKIFKYISTP